MGRRLHDEEDDVTEVGQNDDLGPLDDYEEEAEELEFDEMARRRLFDDEDEEEEDEEFYDFDDLDEDEEEEDEDE